jgi:hypothetical protein
MEYMCADYGRASPRAPNWLLAFMEAAARRHGNAALVLRGVASGSQLDAFCAVRHADDLAVVGLVYLLATLALVMGLRRAAA